MADRNANYQSDLGSLKVNRIIHFRVSISQNVPVCTIDPRYSLVIIIWISTLCGNFIAKAYCYM